jgi:hypothetical protein
VAGDYEDREIEGASLSVSPYEGERGAEARLEHACYPPRPSLVKHLDVKYALREPRTRNILRGFLCNSMPSEFIESCALALATQAVLSFDWNTPATPAQREEFWVAHVLRREAESLIQPQQRDGPSSAPAGRAP